MSALPRDEGYDPVAFPDHHGKFFLPGVVRDEAERVVTKERRADARHVVVTNKLGRAYGFTAITRESRTRDGVARFISPPPWRQRNGVVNDDA